jgi:hypothetical protein
VSVEAAVGSSGGIIMAAGVSVSLWGLSAGCVLLLGDKRDEFAVVLDESKFTVESARFNANFCRLSFGEWRNREGSSGEFSAGSTGEFVSCAP